MLAVIHTKIKILKEMHFIFAHIQEPTDHLGMKGHCQMNSPEEMLAQFITKVGQFAVRSSIIHAEE